MQTLKSAEYHLIRNPGCQASDFPYAIELVRQFTDGKSDSAMIMLVRSRWEAEQLRASLNAEAAAWLDGRVTREAFALGGVH